MFALLIPSRPLLPLPTATLSPTQCSFTLPVSPPFSHLALFLHPGQQLPADTLAAIYLQLPPSPDFKLLGALGPDKQSAMFKVDVGKAGQHSIEGVGGGGGVGGSGVKEEVMTDDATAPPTAPGGEVVVGISIEPAAQVRAQLEATRAARQKETGGAKGGVDAAGGLPSGDVVKRLAQRIGQNAFNFLTGFVEKGSGGKDVFPMKAFQEWWGKFEKKVQLDPGFLLKDGDG